MVSWSPPCMLKFILFNTTRKSVLEEWISGYSFSVWPGCLSDLLLQEKVFAPQDFFMNYPQHRETPTFPLLFEEYYEKTICFETHYPDSQLATGPSSWSSVDKIKFTFFRAARIFVVEEWNSGRSTPHFNPLAYAHSGVDLGLISIYYD